MLHAILLNKSGRNISTTEVHWRQLFMASEDSLTSTIFGGLLYLPRNMFWAILKKACYYDNFPNGENRIMKVDFWPHWNTNGLNNSNFVEPDIFIRTTHFDLIIEAKRHDYDQQYLKQWETEFYGYLNHFGEEEKKVFLLAVGGISDEKEEEIHFNTKTLTVVKTRWYRILQEVKSLKLLIENQKEHINDAINTILADLINGFRIHGYATGEWFANTDFSLLTPIELASEKLWQNSFSNAIKFKFLKKLAEIKINNESMNLLNNLNYEH